MSRSVEHDRHGECSMIAYREAGLAGGPNLSLLHDLPSAGHMLWRESLACGTAASSDCSGPSVNSC
jgi:hypothetical protein